MKTEEPEQIEDKEENQETKRGSKKASEHLKEDNHESSIKEIKEEYKSSNKSNTSIIKNQQKSANENETATLNKSNIGNKSKSINEISNSQSKLEEASKIEDISEYIDNYVAAAKNDKKQKELENSHRERSHDWRRNRINERHSWSEKDLKVTPEMEEKRKKYLESLDQPVDDKMRWEHNKTLMQNFCRETDQFSLDNPGRIRTQLDKIKNSNLDNFPWDSEEQ